MILDVVSPIFVFSVEAIMILIPLIICFLFITSKPSSPSNNINWDNVGPSNDTK